ncbi:uncharacterized protein LOC130630717 isoform X3 [Hydractinia symbiolongicarpus]|uniref:uncharacterized protein LOC130630717 isoform X3 n=1 Tax=Hydractinia symbiolongicarpus TaxID=13093 RepID=UPI00254FFF2B|nr:uncharacterized protein LOC130630717 isoform X3 [Hydractinia symbiolongicarpus]
MTYYNTAHRPTAPSKFDFKKINILTVGVGISNEYVVLWKCIKMVLFDTEIILLVEYLNMRKRIEVFDTDDLKELIETAFSASPVKLSQEYLVQYFDSEIQDYLDLDDEKVLEVNKKIKILPVDDVSLNESLSRSFNEPCAAQPDMNKENDESSSKNEKLVKEPDENVEKLSTFSCGSSSNTKPWPHPFIIKDKMVRPSTLKLLQHKVKLTTADVTSLFSSILDEVIEYTIQHHGNTWN